MHRPHLTALLSLAAAAAAAETSEPPKPVVILTSWGRSGSTVASHLWLKSNPGCFFLDEPMGETCETSPRCALESSIDFFVEMSQCNFDRKVPAPTRWKLWLHRRVNGPDGDADPIGDFEPARLAERCRAATHFCVKEIRLNGLMRKVLPALQARGVPVHIVHLVRDPRAVFMSERRVFKPGTNEATTFNTLCGATLADHKLGRNSTDTPGVQYTPVCFEDLSETPQALTQHVYRRLTAGAAQLGAGAAAGAVPDAVEAYGAEHLMYWRAADGSASTTAKKVGRKTPYKTVMRTSDQLEWWRPKFEAEVASAKDYNASWACKQVNRRIKCAGARYG